MYSEALSPECCSEYKKMYEIFTNNFKEREFLLDNSIPTTRPNIGDVLFTKNLKMNYKKTRKRKSIFKNSKFLKII